jgi:DNA-binding SARP family transcriptional activator
MALSAGKTVSVDRLATALWGQEPPANMRRNVQIYLTRLRGVLGTEAIRTSSTGYVLCIAPENVDALRFVRLLNRASRETDVAVERTLLIEALSLWRGEPFDGVQSAWLDETQRPRLVERYLAAVERRIDIDVASGHSSELVARLGELTAQYPLRESLWVRLLVVLDRSGRQAESVERYEVIRVRIADELGVDRYGEAGTLTRLGDTYHASGDIPAAKDAWRRALTIFDQLGEREADQVRERLHRVTNHRAVPHPAPAPSRVATGRYPM